MRTFAKSSHSHWHVGGQQLARGQLREGAGRRVACRLQRHAFATSGLRLRRPLWSFPELRWA